MAMRLRSIFAALASVSLLVSACGGEEPPANAPPKLPPSMSDHPDETTAAGATATPPPAPAATGAAGALSHPPSADVQRGIRALDAGDLAGAKSAFAAAETKDANDADAAYFSGVVADRGHDSKAAEAHFRRALTLSPGHAAATADLSAIETEDGRNEDAAALCRVAIAKHPEDSVLHLNLAVALAKKGDAGAATSEFEAAIKGDGQQPMYFLTYGHWLMTWKKPEDARTKLQAAHKLAAGDVGMLAGVAHEMLQLQDFSSCVTTLDEAITLQDAGELRMERAFCKAGAKDDAGARADLEAAVKNDPSFAPAHFLLATHLAKAGESARAIAEYQTYVKLAPDTPNAKVAKERMKLLQKKH